MTTLGMPKLTWSRRAAQTTYPSTRTPGVSVQSRHKNENREPQHGKSRVAGDCERLGFKPPDLPRRSPGPLSIRIGMFCEDKHRNCCRHVNIRTADRRPKPQSSTERHGPAGIPGQPSGTPIPLGGKCL